MKKLFTILAVAATLVSCAKEDVVREAEGEAILFGNAFVENSTRAAAATDPSYSTTTGKGVALKSFNVYGAVNGVNIFSGNAVTKGDNVAYGAAWTLDGAKQYWINGADYEFVAVVDGNKTGVTAITPDEAGLPASISYTSDGATDLLCARVERKKDTNGNTDTSLVSFDFTHLLSKVKFSVKNTTNAAATNYRIVLTSAKITGALASNTYKVGETSAWDTVNTTSNTREFTLENLEINSGAQQYHPTELLLLPGVNVNVVVTANVQATDDDGTTWKTVSTMSKTFNSVLGTGTLVANNAYHFAVELGIGTEIQFTATTMPEWGNGNTHDSDNDHVNDNIPLQ